MRRRRKQSEGRIEFLAKVRNAALAPLYSDVFREQVGQRPAAA
jgi:hypothetical protein